MLVSHPPDVPDSRSMSNRSSIVEPSSIFIRWEVLDNSPSGSNSHKGFELLREKFRQFGCCQSQSSVTPIIADQNDNF